MSYSTNIELKMHVETHKLFICVPATALAATSVVQLDPHSQQEETASFFSKSDTGKQLLSVKEVGSHLAGNVEPRKDQQLQEVMESSITQLDAESKGLSKAAAESKSSPPNSEMTAATSDSCKEMVQTSSHSTLEMTVEHIEDDEEDECSDFDEDADEVADAATGSQRDGACGPVLSSACMKDHILSEKQAEAAQPSITLAEDPEKTAAAFPIHDHDSSSTVLELFQKQKGERDATPGEHIQQGRPESPLPTPRKVVINAADEVLEPVSGNTLKENTERQKEFVLACAVCDLHFHAPKHLSAHWVSQHNACSFCSETYSEPSKLCNHLKLAHGQNNNLDRPFLCAFCGRGFKMARYANDHIRMVHVKDGQLHYTERCPPRPHSACAKKDVADNQVLCAKQLKQERSPDLEKSDVMEAPAKDKTLGTLSEDLQSGNAPGCADPHFHTKTEGEAAQSQVFIHEKQETEQSSVDVSDAVLVQSPSGGETFSQLSKKPWNKQKKLLVCGVCDLRFHAAKPLSTHWVSWHNTCNFCDEVFLEPPELCNHLKLVHGQDNSFDRPFLCALCGKGFRMASHVSGHIRMVHAKQDGQLQCTRRCPPRSFCTSAERDAAEGDVSHVVKKEQECSLNSMDEVRPLSVDEALEEESEGLQLTCAPKCAFPLDTKQEDAEDEIVKQEMQDIEQCSCETWHDVHVEPSSEGETPKQTPQKPCEKQKERHEQVLVCGVCDAHFHAAKLLSAHWRSEHNTCSFCGATFFEPRKLCNHLILVHGQDESCIKPFLCALCRAGFQIASYVCDHIRLVHGKRPAYLSPGCIRHPYCRNALFCTNAKKGAVHTELVKKEKEEQLLGLSNKVEDFSAGETLKHIAENYKATNGEEQKEHVFVCGVCGTCFFSARQLSDHWASEHGRCKFCDRIFVDPRKLYSHVRLVHCQDAGSGRPFLCAVCGACSDVARYICDHIRFTHRKKDDQASNALLFSASTHTHHPVQTKTTDHQSSSNIDYDSRIFHCKDCSARFSLRCRLNEHVNDFHRKKRPYQCPTCGENFEFRHHLQTHFREHDSNKRSCFESSSELKPESAGNLQQGCLLQPATIQSSSDSTATDSGASLQVQEQRLDSFATYQDVKVQETSAQHSGDCVTSAPEPDATDGDGPVQGTFAQVFSDSTSTVLEFVASGQTQGVADQLSSDSAAMASVDTLREILVSRAFAQNPSGFMMKASDSVATLQDSPWEAQGNGHKNPIQLKSTLSESDVIFYVDLKDISSQTLLRKKPVEYKCPDCSQVFSFQRRLRKHCKSTHGTEKIFCCPHCPLRFKETYVLLKHVNRKHNSAKPFQCSVCMERFKVKSNLKMHISRQHSVTGTVKKSQKTPGSKTDKSLMKSPGEKEALCSESKTEDQSNVCHFCGKCFASPRYARCHINSLHLNTKAYKCNVCSKTFSANYRLVLHARVHSDEKLFTCDICGKSFMKKNTLTYHRNTHTNAKPYHCKLCHKGFNAHSGLTVHLRRHAGNKCYSCSTCGRRFYSVSALKRHALTHTDLRTLSCSQCGKTYRSSSSLAYHLKHTHPPL